MSPVSGRPETITSGLMLGTTSPEFKAYRTTRSLTSAYTAFLYKAIPVPPAEPSGTPSPKRLMTSAWPLPLVSFNATRKPPVGGVSL